MRGKARIMPARIGARMPGPASTKDIRPLARPYCSFGIIVVIAAEYAGQWKALPNPLTALDMYKCQNCKWPVR